MVNLLLDMSKFNCNTYESYEGEYNKRRLNIVLMSLLLTRELCFYVFNTYYSKLYHFKKLLDVALLTFELKEILF